MSLEECLMPARNGYDAKKGHEDEVASVGSSLASYFTVFHRLLATRLRAALAACVPKGMPLPWQGGGKAGEGGPGDGSARGGGAAAGKHAGGSREVSPAPHVVGTGASQVGGDCEGGSQEDPGVSGEKKGRSRAIMSGCGEQSTTCGKKEDQAGRGQLVICSPNGQLLARRPLPPTHLLTCIPVLLALPQAAALHSLQQLSRELVDSCAHAGHTYLHAQQLLGAAAAHPRGGPVFERLSQDLQAATTALYPAAWGTMGEVWQFAEAEEWV
eukprot:1159863-Pelagomonas_calceolata.AAC.11